MGQPEKKPVLLSGIQPTGNLTIANYLGAIRNWVQLQDTHDCLFVLVDLHALTIAQSPEALRNRCYEFAGLYLACGIDPLQHAVFIQSHVPGHCELQWILNCLTHLGELNRMTQFKDKSQRQKETANAGLYDYPVLMAADILLYGTERVPVGDDQIQHLELTRRLAERFNHRYGHIFTLPRPYVPSNGARVMSLQAPEAKMSKTDANPESYIGLLDPPEQIRKKIRRAVTDSGREVVYDAAKPGISNLLTIYSTIVQTPIPEIEARYAGKGYAAFKNDLADILITFSTPIKKRYEKLATDRRYIDEVLQSGAHRAECRSRPMIETVHEAVGLVHRKH